MKPMGMNEMVHHKKQRWKGLFDVDLLMVMHQVAEDCSHATTQSHSNELLFEASAVHSDLFESYDAIPRPQPPLRGLLDSLSVEQRIAQTINAQRLAAKLPPLVYDARLAGIAQRHSQDMAMKGYFSHINDQGQDPTGRALAHGYPVTVWRREGWISSHVAENLCLNYLTTDLLDCKGHLRLHSESNLVSSTVEEWMASAAHRESILTSYYERQGIGVAVTAEGKVYITQLLW